MNKLTFSEALNRMAALCSGSEHCDSDIRERLQRAGVSQDDIERILQKLHEEHFVDNGRYCRAFSRDKVRFSHWGRMKVQMALRSRGLPDEDIQSALDELPSEEYQAALRKTLQEKERTLRDSDPYTRRNKLIRFAASRGFTFDECCRLLGDES